jgi:hypothetical protein
MLLRGWPIGVMQSTSREVNASMFPIPKAFFLTKGIGVQKEQLTAFELALRDADIEQQNLVTTPLTRCL